MKTNFLLYGLFIILWLNSCKDPCEHTFTTELQVIFSNSNATTDTVSAITIVAENGKFMTSTDTSAMQTGIQTDTKLSFPISGNSAKFICQYKNGFSDTFPITFELQSSYKKRCRYNLTLRYLKIAPSNSGKKMNYYGPDFRALYFNI